MEMCQAKPLPSGPMHSLPGWSQESPPTPGLHDSLLVKMHRKGNSCKNLLFQVPEASEPSMKSLVWDSFFIYFILFVFNCCSNLS